MARIIEFHIPDGFKPKIKSVTEQERGRLIVFPDNLQKSVTSELLKQVIQNVLGGRANGQINDATADLADEFRFKDYGIGFTDR